MSKSFQTKIEPYEFYNKYASQDYVLCGIRFDFFEKEDLPLTFREFLPHIGTCKFTKCSHTKEQGCSIVEAVRNGEIAKSRHQSFLALYEVLKKKTKW